jgi:hypothetical protein
MSSTIGKYTMLMNDGTTNATCKNLIGIYIQYVGICVNDTVTNFTDNRVDIYTCNRFVNTTYCNNPKKRTFFCPL